MGWFDSVEHSRWLSSQMRALLAQGHAAKADTGFGYFSPEGGVDRGKPVDLAITARMTYAYSLGTLLGIPGSRRFCDHGIRCLTEYFKDPEYGGWFSAIKHEPADGHGVPWDETTADKWQYAHAFLVLAAATASVANRPGAFELLREALENQEQYWLSAENGLVRNGYLRDWSETIPYRGMNSLMHTVEAYLAAAEATTNPQWIARAEKMLRFVNEVAAPFDWRVPEHYSSSWAPDPTFNKDDPDSRYSPYGSMIGHSMELSRLAVQLRAALRSLGNPEPEYLLSMSSDLFETARIDGWRRDGVPGFIYTVDFDGNPVISDHYQWVVSEGICSTVALRRALLDDGATQGEVEAYEHSYRSWLDYLNDDMMIEPGRFVRVLGADNEPVRESVPTRPDIYHTIQAMLLPRLPLWPPFGAALSRNLLDHPEQPPADKKSWNMFSRK